MDEISMKIFHEVVTHPKTTSKEIESALYLSKNQVNYGLSKINEYLEDNQVKASVSRARDGNIVVTEDIIKVFHAMSEHLHERYNFNANERLTIIIYLILSSRDFLSIYYFMIELDVSKNTIMRDMANVKKELAAYRLELKYNRKDGYDIIGKTSDLRCLLHSIIFKMLQLSNGRILLQKMSGIDKQALEAWQQKMADYEQLNQVQYADGKLEEFCYFMVIVKRQIKNGHTIEKGYIERLAKFIDFTGFRLGVSDTVLETIPEERHYFFAKVLSLPMKKCASAQVEKIDGIGLKKAIHQFLELLENRMAICFTNREDLANKLFLHLYPAYFRVHYLTEINDFHLKIDDEIRPIYNIVKECLQPLEELFQFHFPEDEIILLSFFVGSNLLQVSHQLNEDKKIEAIIVCPNGIIFSTMIENQLVRVYQEILNFQTMSLREFESHKFSDKELRKKIIFSTVEIPDVTQLILIDTNFGHHYFETLTVIVNRELERIRQQYFGIEAVLDLIKSHVKDVDDETIFKLSEALQSSYEQNKQVNEIKLPSRKTSQVREKNLSDFLSQNKIKIVDRISWAAALEVTCQMLIEEGSITSEYLGVLQAEYPVPDLSICLSNTILIPHANPNQGVNQSDFSLLICKEGIQSDLGVFHFVMTICVADKNYPDGHIKAMSQLMTLSMNQEVLATLQREEDKDKLIELIQINEKEE
ncbi:PTS sugar transporter subunit IIA [Bacilli bacterium]|nr:PTS sugar transporter subunit IIA [Bacilli bacterium]